MTASGHPKWTRWKQEWADNISRTENTVAPPAEMPATDPAPNHHIWDSWPLRTRSGEVATIDDWQVLISLTAPATVTPEARHDIAEHRYFISRDGQDWIDCGPVFGDDALGTRQWAGSAMYDDGDIYCYYTAAGDPNTEPLSYTQRIAVGHGGTIDTSDGTVSIEGPWTHEILLEPDGEWYETQAQSKEMTYTFRDPWFFEDPETDRTQLLFEANTPPTADYCSGNSELQTFNGCVGLAVSPSGDPLDWELCPPIFDSVCVNQEIERPHVVYREGQYYLFVSSHVDTFAPGLAGYDGLYGFVSESLDGVYQPLNGSGLVVTNPASAPFQAYSWLAVSHGQELLVSSFLNYPSFSGTAIGEIVELSGDERRKQFAGTLTPTLRLAVDGHQTQVQGSLSHWALPSEDLSLPPLDTELSLPAEELDTEPGLTRTDSRREGGPFW